jgi:choline monooxygenase
LQTGFSRGGADVFDLPKNAPDYGKNISAYYFFVFPNLMFNFYPWGLSVNIVKPISPGLTKVSFLSYVADEKKLALGAGADLDKVEREDEAIVENVQRGVRSRFYDRGRYSPTRETGTHHFHRLIAEFMR